MAKELNSASFDAEVLSCKGKVVVDFWAPWCGPCRSQAPILEDFAKKNISVKTVKVNVDENEQLAVRYEVMSIPTLLVFEDGKLINKAVGLQKVDSLERLCKLI